MNFCELIKKHADKQLAAHIYKESTMSYKELDEKSDSLAAYIIDEYGEDNTPILVYGHKEHLMLICFFACIKSGHAYIPVDSSMPMERVKEIVKISGVRMILNVASKDLVYEKILMHDAYKIESIIFDRYGMHPNENFRVQGENIHYIIYTSGSTGKPKGVKITSNCLDSFVSWAVKLLEYKEGNYYTFMNQAPFSFDLSVMDLYISLYTGSTLYSIDKEMTASLKQLFSYFKTSRISTWVSTPSFAEMCLADSSFNSELLPEMKHMLFCGEVLTNNCAAKLSERFNTAKFINFYGPTEATVAVTAIEIDRRICNDKNPLPVGYVKDDCKIFIAEEAGESEKNIQGFDLNGKRYKILPEGEKGEIIIAGKSVSPGYLNNDDGTSRVFSKCFIDGAEERLYKTGDEGYIKEGLLYYSGRIDFQVKLNGYRVELEDIENNLLNIEFIEKAVVLPVMKQEKISYLAAVITLNKSFLEKDFIIGQAVREKLKALLPEYMVPRKIIIKESLPMTLNGKINRKLLMEELV